MRNAKLHQARSKKYVDTRSVFTGMLHMQLCLIENKESESRLKVSLQLSDDQSTEFLPSFLPVP